MRNKGWCGSHVHCRYHPEDLHELDRDFKQREAADKVPRGRFKLLVRVAHDFSVLLLRNPKLLSRLRREE